MVRSEGETPTLDQVARLAGVSKATASRAVNGGARVSPQAQAAVDDAVRRLGFIPNAAARSLATRRTGSIGLIVPESDERIFADPFFARMLHVVTRSVKAHDLQLVLLLTQPGKEEQRLMRYLRGRFVDGVVVASHHRGDRLAKSLADLGLPTVFIGSPWTSTDRVSIVESDGIGAGRQAARLLIDRGCRAIGTIAGPADMHAGHDRLEGWRQELSEAGLGVDAVVHGDFTEVGGARACGVLLDEFPGLDGIFAASDLMAAGAIRELAARGRRVPEDVALVGYDDLGTAERTDPPLTTFRNPIGAMATEAIRLLAQWIDEGPGEPPRRIVFAPELVRRASA
ncbi:LacI family transcriptional regulator [Actinoallomurus sp. NBC_01490]|uniref:LacI family DNA-binding transcriptional regulator n=1 Tax=Actinoallomurus sp. NBC_01490 TaxID=2903557 RepID=UPI002E36AD1C|nr:LacI family DNA-binding transcriptional regulator [Actinoallomurus sp. NBC_01490]